MDNEKTRELKLSAVATGRLPLTRRQQRSLSSVHLNSTNGKEQHLSEKLMTVEKLKKEKVRESKGGSLNDGDGDGNEGADVVRSPLGAVAASASCSRKRVKLVRKVSDDYGPVDSSLVPRKLRSVINKRSGDLPLPRTNSEYRKCNGIPCKNETSGALSSMVKGLITKEEEEVAEILTALGAMMATDRRVPNDVTDIKETHFISIPKASTDADTPVQRLSTDIFPGEVLKGTSVVAVDVAKEGVTIVSPESVKENMDVNVTTASNHKRSTSFLKGGHCLNFMDVLRSGCVTNVTPDATSLNRQNHSAQVSNPLVLKPAGQPEEISAITKTLPLLPLTNSEEAALKKQSSMVTAVSDNSIWSFSTKVDKFPSLPSSNSEQPKEKFPHHLADKRQWKRCATHAYIGRLIQNYQHERRKDNASPCNQLKFKEVTNSTMNGPSSSAFRMPCSSVARNQHVMTAEVPQDRKIQSIEQPCVTSAKHSQRKHTYDFPSLPAGHESNGLGSKIELPGKHPIAYLHALPNQHSMAPSSMSHAHRSSYPDYVTPAAPQQVQLQPPQYVSYPLYTIQSGNAMKHPSHQQQQMWQAQLAHYRPSLPLLPKWPVKKQQDASASFVPCPPGVQMPVAGPRSLDVNHVTAHCSLVPLQHRTMPVQLPALNHMK